MTTCPHCSYATWKESDVANPLNILSLCSGVGWLDEGVQIGLAHLGIESRVVAYVERDSYAASVLLARMEDAALESAPVFGGDFADLDASGIPVDVLVAGLPCQPYSCAGKQQGNSDRRSWGDGDGPLPHCLRIISECRPALVYFENVPAWVRGGWFRPFGEELCRMGYEIESPLFVTAASVGASHKRERVFVLAHSERGGRGQVQQPTSGGRPDVAGFGEAMADARESSIQQAASGRPSGAGGTAVAVGGRAMGDAKGQRTGQGALPSRDKPQKPLTANGSDAVGNASGARAGNNAAGSGARDSTGEPGGSMERAGYSLFAPGPSDPRWAVILQHSPHLAPAVESGFRVLADGRTFLVDESRTDQLRCSGNGCVAIQSALALVELMRGIQ